MRFLETGLKASLDQSRDEVQTGPDSRIQVQIHDQIQDPDPSISDLSSIFINS